MTELSAEVATTIKSVFQEKAPHRVEAHIAGACVSWPVHTAHWKVFDRGHAWMDIQVSRAGGWLSLDTQERTADGKSSKRTMVTLDKKSAAALRDFLNKYLPE